MFRRARASRALHRPVRAKVLAFVATVVAVVPGAVTGAPAQASPAQEYSGPYFGADNFPPGCIRDFRMSNPANICFHAKAELHPLDSPKVDVLILVPASPTTERDMRIARQAVDMWEGGIDYLAPQMGLDWLADGMDFHITVDSFDPFGTNGGEFTTYPVVDPEIVVITGNPVPTGGVGVEPLKLADLTLKAADSLVALADDPLPVDLPRLSGLVIEDEESAPCHNVENPFDFEYWENLPGFDRHHEARSGTYVEDCGGAGGNVCFVVAGGVDPLPDRTDGYKTFFDLVAHEFGHCLSVGHVGDGLEGGGVPGVVAGQPWGPVPYSDIMSYSDYPALHNTCVSTLNVEVVAVRMSRYLDTNGDGAVDAADRLLANDQIGQGNRPLQVQHPDAYLHASGTGRALDCPQPDLGLLPGEPTDWTPEPVDSVDHLLELSSPADGAVSNDGRFDVAGTVERRSLSDDPTNPSASTTDASGDSSSAYTDLLGLDVTLTDTDLHATMRMAEIWTATDTSPVRYTLMVNGQAITFSPSMAEIDNVEKTITLRLSRLSLRGYGFRGPYEVSASSRINVPLSVIDDDYAPEPGHVLAVGDPAVEDGVEVATGQVHVYVDDVHAGTQDVDTSDGGDTFSLPVDVAEGTHVVRVDWEDAGEVVATKSVSVTHNTSGRQGRSPEGTLSST